MRCRVLLLTLVLVKSPNFIVKVSETLSLIKCLQSEDCNANLEIIFYTCGIVSKNFYFCGRKIAPNNKGY